MGLINPIFYIKIILFINEIIYLPKNNIKNIEHNNAGPKGIATKPFSLTVFFKRVIVSIAKKINAIIKAKIIYKFKLNFM